MRRYPRMWPRRDQIERGLIVLFIAGIIVVLYKIPRVLPHDFYPSYCCSGDEHTGDCAPLARSRVEEVQGGWYVDGSFFVSRADARDSPDGQYHACFPYGQLRCFFRPVPSA